MGCFKKRETQIKEAVYVAWRFESPIEDPEIAEAVTIVRLCEHFGWSMEYAESLDHFQRAKIFGVLAGDQKIQKKQQTEART